LGKKAFSGRRAISLCIVARNEAAFLQDCIASARPVVDEVVVVDTGSSDGTPEIASQAGARLIRADWPGDLGRAHNLPLEYARGDWILSLDADEVLDPTRRHRVRELVASSRAEAYRLPIRNYSYEPTPKWRAADSTDPLARGALGYIPTRPVRLFRRGPYYRFSGFLHQTIAPSILEQGDHIGETDVVIHHYGFLRSDRSKSTLYRTLAGRQIAAEPRNPRAWIELGIVLFPNDLDAALHAFRSARLLGLRSTAGFYIGWTLIEKGRPGAGIPFLQQAIRGNPRDELVDYDKSDAWELLGRAYEMLGDPRKTERTYRRAIGARPDSPVALNNLAGLLVERGATSEASTLLDRLLVRYRGLDMVWATLGALRLRHGDVGRARQAFGTALDIDSRCLPSYANPALAGDRAGLPDKRGQPHALAREGMDTRAVLKLGSGAKLPPRGSRSAPGRLPSLGSGTVVNLITHLQDGAERVLLNVVNALRDRHQLVLCCDIGGRTDQDVRAEVVGAGVETLTVASPVALRRTLNHVRPECIFHHWWDTSPFSGPARTGNERWIAIGHAALPMPFGYDAYVVLSKYHSRLQGHLPPDRIHRIANRVDLRRFRPRPGRSGTPVTIAMMSRLEPGRFPRRLLAYLPPLDALGAQLLIAGPGGRRYEIEPEIAQTGLTKVVHFVGPISSEHVPDFLAQADIGLHLSETHFEVCSVAVLEMMAAGLPIVAEPKGSLPEMVIPAENAFLASGEEQIAEHLRELIRSPKLRKRMGEASRQIAIKHNMANSPSAWRELVDEVCDRRNRPRPAPVPYRKGQPPP
jgi:glycosyltransferase involved in cell wall biosynthesis